MTTYYVRKTGNNSNNGTSAGTAYLTVSKAATVVAAGDTVYIGAGIYRELVTLSTSGSSGSVITWIADIDGSQTGDAGLVWISAYASEATDTNSRTAAVALAKKTFNVFKYLILDGGSTAALNDADTSTASAYEGVEFDNCIIQAPSFNGINNNRAASLTIAAGVSPSTAGLTFKRCTFIGQCDFKFSRNSSADVNVKWLFQNCIALRSYSGSVAFNFVDSGSGSFDVCGFTIRGCTFYGQSLAGIQFSYGTSTTLATANAVDNCSFYHCAAGVVRTGANQASINSKNNRYCICGSQGGSVMTDDTTSKQVNSVAFGGLHDAPYYYLLGWSPYLPWEPIYSSGQYVNDNVDNGTASLLTDDFYSNPRPGLRAADVGAVEYRARFTQESSVVDAGTYSGLMSGAGYHDFPAVPVAASTTYTVTVRSRHDSNYAGTLPQLIIKNIPSGVADVTTTGVAAANTWETLTASFTTTAAGYVRIRLQSNDTSSTGKCYFDTGTGPA